MVLSFTQKTKQYKLLNRPRVENAGKGKLLKKLDREILQPNASFTTLSRELIMLTYDKISF